MEALVVTAHTSELGRAATTAAVDGLTDAGHTVVLVDLHRDGFVAAMTPAEREAYHSDDPILDPLVERYAASVRRAEILVFVYPTRWSTLPPILKGFLDRTLVPGVGFAFDERSGKVRPALTQVRHIVGISTYDAPRASVAFTNDNGRRIITRALRMSCGLRARPRWLPLYDADHRGDDHRRAHLDRVRSRLARI